MKITKQAMVDFMHGPKGKAAVAGGVALALTVLLSVGFANRLNDPVKVSSGGLNDDSMLTSDEVDESAAATGERNVAREVRAKLEKLLEDRDEWGPGYSLHSIKLTPAGRNAYTGSAKVSSIDFERDLNISYSVKVEVGGVKVENFKDSFD